MQNKACPNDKNSPARMTLHIAETVTTGNSKALQNEIRNILSEVLRAEAARRVHETCKNTAAGQL